MGDILNEQENPTEDNFQAEAQVAVNEEQENSFIAQNESKTVSPLSVDLRSEQA